MNTTSLTLTALAVLAAAACAAPVPVNSGALSYSQNFDSLGSATVAWTNDSTIPGWYAQINNGTTATGSAQASNGTSSSLTGILNLGAAGAGDRALGSKCTGTGGFANIACAVSFQNTGATALSLTQLQYTGELWRTNTGTGTPLVAVSEECTVFSQVSNSPVTNIISGTDNGTAAPGTGFTALGAGANWVAPVNTPLAVNNSATGSLDGNAAANRTTVAFGPSGVTLLPGQYLMLKWTDTNELGTDGHQGIDDVTVTFTELSGVLTPSVTALTRNSQGTLADPADDTFGFTVSVAGTGSGVGTGWTTTDVSPPNSASANYNAPVVWSGFPVATAKAATFTDNTNALFTAAISVAPPKVIGMNNAPATADNVFADVDAAWTVNETLRTLSMNNGPGAPARIISGLPVNLSSVSGVVRFDATLTATDTSSGFETSDTVLAQLVLNDGVSDSTVNLATPFDTNTNGVMEGAEIAPGGGTVDVPTVRTYALTTNIPDNIVSARLVISGVNNSLNETLEIKDIQFSVAPPSLNAVAGVVTAANQNTVNPADDTFSAPVTIAPGNNAPSIGWTSDSPPPASGNYADAQPVTFGPYPVSGGAKTVTLTDNSHPAAVAAFTLTPPAPVLTASAATNIVRHENGPGLADDTVTFDVTVAGTSGGPSWTATGATPASGSFGTVTFTVPAGTSTVTVSISDASYPAATQDVIVTLPARYIFGFIYDGTVLSDLFSDPATPPAPAWINDPLLHTLDMNTGGTSDKIVASDVLNLTSTGAVYFSAYLRAFETSTGSNFDVGDRFKAELVVDGGTPVEQIVNLVSALDTGDGASSTVAPGTNGPQNGYLNGYSGTAGLDLVSNIDYTALGAEEEYNANMNRDEFNRRGEIADIQIDNNIVLSATVPAGANAVQLRIYGAGIAGSEFFNVSRVLFSTVAPTVDSDGDGVTDLTELTDGTDPQDPASLFTIATITSGPGGEQIASFPTVLGRSYRGYTGTDLLTWTRDDSVPLVTGDGTVQSWTLPNTGVRNYLKVLSGFTPADFPATLP